MSVFLTRSRLWRSSALAVVAALSVAAPVAVAADGDPSESVAPAEEAAPSDAPLDVEPEATTTTTSTTTTTTTTTVPPTTTTTTIAPSTEPPAPTTAPPADVETTAFEDAAPETSAPDIAPAEADVTETSEPDESTTTTTSTTSTTVPADDDLLVDPSSRTALDIVAAAVIPGAVTDVRIAEDTTNVYDVMRLELDWSVPNTATEGDTFSITLPPELTVSDGIAFPLTAPDGSVVANALTQGGVATFTLTDYVDNFGDVSGDAFFEVRWNLGVITPDTTYELDFVTESGTFTDTVTINPANPTVTDYKYMNYSLNPAWNGSSPNTLLSWGLVSREITQADVGSTITFVESPGNGTTVDCATLVLYDGSYNQFGGASADDPIAAPITCDGSSASVSITITDTYVGGPIILLGWNIIELSQQLNFENNGSITIAGETVPVSDDARRDTGGGTGGGNVRVSVGDYVWFDENADGIQNDGADNGLPGVTLTLTGPDGNPVIDVDGNFVAPTQTDANGFYSFDDLPPLPVGESYTVTVTPPDGYIPTLPNVGDPASDSSTGSAESGDLINNGDRDPTLDFGFILPQPSIDIEKLDIDGNDADTADDAVELADGTTTLDFVITNDGGEPLEMIEVTDVVVSGGTVTGLTCTFPDQSTGTTWDGPFEIDATFQCTAELTGVVPNTAHQNTASVSGVGVLSDEDVDDSDDYHAIRPSVSVGDYVWLDTNRDGIQDDDESGIPGVTLTLTGPDGGEVTDVNGNPVPPTQTDGDGLYSFDDLPVLEDGQSYTVTITPPDDLLPTIANSTTRDADSDTGSASSEGLTMDGDRDPTLDFGFITPAVSVGDYVWLDTNRDGIQDDDESGIPGVTLTLTGPDGGEVTDINGNPVPPTQTDGDGLYSFDDLPVLEDGQSYTVTVTPPDGFIPTIPNATERDADSDTGSASSESLTDDGDRDPTLDFGFVAPAVSVGDYVWLDTNRDGVQDGDESGIPGVTLTLTGPDGGEVTDINGNPVPPTQTDGDGLYSFDLLPVLEDGQSYTVTVTPPDGLVPTIPNATGRDADSDTGSASSEGLTEDGDRDPTLDFGFVTPRVSVGDYVWLDTNKDGIQDGDESGIPGVTLTLTGPDGGEVTDINGNPVPPTVTDADGLYSFDDLPVLEDGQSYTVTVTPPEGLLTTTPNATSRDADSDTASASSEGLTEDGERDPTLDFGFFTPSVSVGDFVWLDTDRDGVQDEGEPPLAGVTLTLTGPDGGPVTDIYGNEVPPQVTDENGTYGFEDLPVLEDGQSYTVTVTPPDGYEPTLENVGDRATDSSISFEVSGDLTEDGMFDITLDFGFIEVEEPPTDEPPSEDPPSTNPPSDQPTPRTGTLPQTGGNTAGWALSLALVLLALGVAAQVTVRRRSSSV